MFPWLVRIDESEAEKLGVGSWKLSEKLVGKMEQFQFFEKIVVCPAEREENVFEREGVKSLFI